jgi:hypothetical protein
MATAAWSTFKDIVGHVKINQCPEVIHLWEELQLVALHLHMLEPRELAE